MSRNLLGRGLAVVVMALLFGAYINHDYQKWRRLGRDAFVAHELERFDHFIAPSDSFGVVLIGAIVLVTFIFGLYELVVFILTVALTSTTAPGQVGPTDDRGVPFT